MTSREDLDGVRGALRALAADLLKDSSMEDAEGLFLAVECGELEVEVAELGSPLDPEYVEPSAAISIIARIAERLQGTPGTVALAASLGSLLERVQAR